MVLSLRVSAIKETFAETTRIVIEINNSMDRSLASLERITEYVKQLALNQGVDPDQIDSILNHHKSTITNAELPIANAKADIGSTTKILQQMEESTYQQFNKAVVAPE